VPELIGASAAHLPASSAQLIDGVILWCER
jgi:hypothetical protein